MNMNKTALILVLATPLLAGCQTGEQALIEYSSIKTQCMRDSADGLSPDEQHRLLDPSVKQKTRAAENRCLAQFKREHPDTVAKAEGYSNYLSVRYPYATSTPSSEVIITDRHGNYVGGVEYYGNIGIAR